MPLAAITAWRLLRYVCISFTHLDLGISPHSSLQICSSSIKLEGKRQWTAVFKSFQKISMGFESGLGLGHSRTFTFLFWSHSSVALAGCLGSLSYWNVNLHGSLKSFALWSSFFSRICLYLAPFMVPSIPTSLPVPAKEKHPHSMMLPPPCFTLAMVLKYSVHPPFSGVQCAPCGVQASQELKVMRLNDSRSVRSVLLLALLFSPTCNNLVILICNCWVNAGMSFSCILDLVF